MARAGVTYHDIAKTAKAIRARGQAPSVDRVREQLGTGSKSTIAPLLSLETTQASLESAQSKVKFLTGENKIILQEKAVIQGLFQQLQASL